MLRRNPHNPVAQLVISISTSEHMVGHMPLNLAPVFSHFLKKTSNKVTSAITSYRVNCGGGTGIKVFCVYWLYGPKAHIDRAKTMFRDDPGQTN